MATARSSTVRNEIADDKLKGHLPFGLSLRSYWGIGRDMVWNQIRLFLAKVPWTFYLGQTRGQDATFDKDYSTHAMRYKPGKICKTIKNI
ncbi:hypothetical protein F5B20DRAFT_544279 [Whalleya microplaca]|nr:hypothetical protein F5B20DRAFT_544279 [Whalleya microplaca]